MKCKVLISLFILLPLSIHAQMGKLFDADKQMSSSFTTQIYLDRDGFIWVATRNGLNRYDGYQFRILKKESRKDLGMASNYVNCIMQDHNGLFYVGMYGALQTYDGERFQSVVTYGAEGNPVPCYVTIADQARTIRIPVHMVETINKLMRVQRQLLQELGREPTEEEAFLFSGRRAPAHYFRHL